MRSQLAATLLLLLPVTATFAAPAPPAQQQAAAVVSAVQFPGRENVKEETLREAIKLKAGQSFTAEQMEADRKALLALGYFRSVQAVKQGTDAQITVSFRLVEWPTVKHLRVLGNTVIDKKAIQEVISTQLGQVLCAPQLQDDIGAIEKLYREHGYVARVSEDILEDAVKTGILRFDILEFQIADVVLEGATQEVRDRCRKVLVEIPPELYKPEAVGIDQRRMLREKGVKNAVAKVEPISPGKVRIHWVINPPAEKTQTGG